jgi:hypothetical protein
MAHNVSLSALRLSKYIRIAVSVHLTGSALSLYAAHGKIPLPPPKYKKYLSKEVNFTNNIIFD